MLRIGSILYGFCGGEFRRDSHEDKRIEAIGHDWVVVRDAYDGVPDFYHGNPEDLEQYTVREEDI